MQLDTNVINKINDRHKILEDGLKKSVIIATEIGGLLVDCKEKVGHGNFIHWVNQNCNFSERSARNYLMLHKYSDKTANIADLQNAYKLIESEEQKEKEAKRIDQSSKFQYREKHNEKPETWERSDDYAWSKRVTEQNERTERVEKLKQEMESESSKKVEEDTYDWDKHKTMVDDAMNILNKRGSINMGGTMEELLNGIEDWLSELPDDNRRQEACGNIIKFAKDQRLRYVQA